MVTVYISRAKAKQKGGFYITCPHCGRLVLAQTHGINKVGVCAMGIYGTSMHQLKEAYDQLVLFNDTHAAEIKGEFVIAIDSPLARLVKRFKGDK